MFTFKHIETLLQDVRYGARVLLKNPGFSSTAIVTLALGIGVNVAIFSLVYGVLLRPLPYQSGDRLVVLHQQASRVNAPDVPFSVKEIADYRDTSHTLDAVVEHHSMSFTLFGNGDAERVNAAVVSANFFDVLGIQPLLGRNFRASDDEHGADAVLILSNKYWKAHNGGDPAVVGKVFQMNDRPHTVIGVLPPMPQYPVESDVYMPTSACPFRSASTFIANRQSRMMTAFGRLKPGVPVDQAQADLSTVAQQMVKGYPDAYPASMGYRMNVAPLRADLTRKAQSTFLVLLGAAGLVLLIACANVANLLLARLLKLERELALRAALGAGKVRLIRQLLTESLLLSVAGGALGLALAPATLKLLVKFAERFTTRAAEVKIDTPILLFAALLSLGAGLLFGLWPAFSSSRNVSEALKQGARSTGDRGSQGLRAGLVVAQIAVSFILLIGAGLMIRSFVKLQRVDPGFSPARLLTMRISPSFTHYTQTQHFLTLTANVLNHVDAVSGVESAALASNFPFNPARLANGPTSVEFRIKGRPFSPSDPVMQMDLDGVTPAYFQTIRQPVVAGRLLDEHDDEKAPAVAVINQTLARHRWPSEDPVGKFISLDAGQTWIQIVGIVEDTKEYGLARAVGDVVYAPNRQLGFFPVNLVVRTSADPTTVASSLRVAIREVDPELAVDRVATIEGLEAESITAPRVTAILLGLFAALALVISASGVAAVMALAVSQRTSELGIRMALGASRESVVFMVLRQGLYLALGGAALGIAGALALTRLVSTLLYDTSPTDLFTFAATSLLFLAVAATACFVPARQITAIDPMLALRQE
jgi:putative ABC transport system permease protein